MHIYNIETTASGCIQQIYDLSLRSEEVCQWVYQRVRGLSVAKLLMTEDEDGIFVEYTVVAMVHMIILRVTRCAPACGWCAPGFLKLILCRLSVCVCPCPRLLITSGVI